VELARRRGLLLIEDCAQAFAGLGYQGHPEADASMFSFGTIKSGTALGGGVLRVRSPELLSRMRAAQAEYPVQGRWHYFTRLAKCAVLKTLSCRVVAATFVCICRAAGRDYDRWVNGASRGFPGDDFFRQIRRQPGAPLLGVLEARLKSWDRRRFERHEAKGRTLTGLLQQSVACPGATVSPHTYWVFPIIVGEPGRVIDRLSRAGFDATQGQSLCVVSVPAGRPEQATPAADELLAKIVFLPFYPELPERESQRMAEVVLELTGEKRPG
jgi:perosamine synthetase